LSRRVEVKRIGHWIGFVQGTAEASEALYHSTGASRPNKLGLYGISTGLTMTGPNELAEVYNSEEANEGRRKLRGVRSRRQAAMQNTNRNERILLLIVRTAPVCSEPKLSVEGK
jgi:hypothetical protein